jgi:hypothetical protein
MSTKFRRLALRFSFVDAGTSAGAAAVSSTTAEEFFLPFLFDPAALLLSASVQSKPLNRL